MSIVIVWIDRQLRRRRGVVERVEDLCFQVIAEDSIGGLVVGLGPRNQVRAALEGHKARLREEHLGLQKLLCATEARSTAGEITVIDRLLGLLKEKGGFGHGEP